MEVGDLSRRFIRNSSFKSPRCSPFRFFQRLNSSHFLPLINSRFSHLGRDLSGRMWESFALPTADAPDTVPSSPHEGIAQFYTFKLLDWLGDERLVKAFLALEKSSAPVYRVWRETE